jgi:hypothetical protein
LGWEEGDAARCFFAAIAAAGAGCDGFEAGGAVFALGATSVSLPSESKINWLEPNQNCRSVTRTTSSATRRSARARISLRGCELSRDTRACEVGTVGLGLSSSICVDPGSDATTIYCVTRAVITRARGGGLGARVGHAEGRGLGSRVGSPLIMIHSLRSPSACGTGTSMSPQKARLGPIRAVRQEVPGVPIRLADFAVRC